MTQSTIARDVPAVLETDRRAPRDEARTGQPIKPLRSTPGVSSATPSQRDRATGPPGERSIDIPTATSELDSYIPSSLLSTPPLASMPIPIVSPQVEAADLTLVAVFSIYIDETGLVRHVIAEEPAPLPELEQAVRKAFTDAHFLPGQVGSVLVKSKIRIEVSFGDAG
ncbi:hypothetical protein [Variovorax sp. GT1P44]|uniref:hypothetical protein n=1 Tax=Variovorax sp. GT1P44 TaxID=3443742 RepID=UPI003F486603